MGWEGWPELGWAQMPDLVLNKKSLERRGAASPQETASLDEVKS